MDAQNMTVVIAGLGVSGTAAARGLAGSGERVVVLEARDGAAQREAAAELAALGVEVRFGEQSLPEGTSLVITSPGWRPDHPLLVAAARAGIQVIGEVELAWHLRASDGSAAPWLALTGTNGKTTAVRMLTAILTAAGHKALAVGNVGVPIVAAVREPYDVLAVELSSFQLHWSFGDLRGRREIAGEHGDPASPNENAERQGPQPVAAALLNVAPDHIDWHGSLEEYAAA
jgi:UDP-N-acetylmuramoylalanine--D-glutamate ligase